MSPWVLNDDETQLVEISDEEHYDRQAKAAPHVLWIPVGDWGNGWIGVKDDYSVEHPNTMSGASYATPSTIPKFRKGDRVQAVRLADEGYQNRDDRADEWMKRSAPHIGQVGHVVRQIDDNLYAVRFQDGAVVGWYANELQKVKVDVTPDIRV